MPGELSHPDLSKIKVH